MSSRTDQGLSAKVTDAALLEEGARILSLPGCPPAGDERGTSRATASRQPSPRSAARAKRRAS